MTECTRASIRAALKKPRHRQVDTFIDGFLCIASAMIAANRDINVGSLNMPSDPEKLRHAANQNKGGPFDDPYVDVRGTSYDPNSRRGGLDEISRTAVDAGLKRDTTVLFDIRHGSTQLVFRSADNTR
jgi:hypothetical protein